MSQPLTFSIKTLGCKVNCYESELLAENAARLGLVRSTFPASDIALVNACSVTARTEAKVRYELAKALRGGCRSVILCGCASERLRDEAARKSASLRVVAGPDKISGVAEALAEAVAELAERPLTGAAAPAFRLSSFPGRARAFVKVQDGCRAFCSYCIVPLLRPCVSSRPPEDIMEEVRGIERAGHREVVITGVHAGSYDYSGTTLGSLLERILSGSSIPRIRLSSIEPLEISEGLLRLLRNEPRLCPHIHLPLQSASDRVLGRMNRNYTFSRYRDIASAIREAAPGATITTDMIVGFPGETDEDFRLSLEAVGEIGFLKVHVFPFSPRPGTAAFGLPGRISPAVMKARKKALACAALSASLAEKEKWLGRTASVLFEGPLKSAPELLSGFTGNYMKVAARAPSRLRNTEVQVVLDTLDSKGSIIGHCL